jgi:transposase-like protein
VTKSPPLKTLFNPTNGDRPVKPNQLQRRKCDSCHRVFIGGAWHRRCSLCAVNPPPPRPNEWPKEKQLQLEALVEEGLGPLEIARRMNLSKGSVIGRLHRQALNKEPPRKPIVQWSYPPSGCCHWPHGDPALPGFKFCGNRIESIGKPYCMKHMSVAFSRATER